MKARPECQHKCVFVCAPVYKVTGGYLFLTTFLIFQRIHIFQHKYVNINMSVCLSIYLYLSIHSIVLNSTALILIQRPIYK